MRKSILFSTLLFSTLLGACSTNVKLLELRRSQLQAVEAAAAQTSALAAQAEFEPNKYDLYVMLNAHLFDDMLKGFDNTTIPIENGRPIDITLSSARMAFRPGYPDLRMAAVAVDRKSGLRADLELDLRLLIEGDPNAPDTLYLKPVATRIVPRLRWGLLDFTRWRFARRLLELQAAQLTDRIPRLKIPVQSQFVIGGKAGSQVVQIPTGDGYITGDLAYPSTERPARIAVKHILFLKNGVHIFAQVEGL